MNAMMRNNLLKSGSWWFIFCVFVYCLIICWFYVVYTFFSSYGVSFFPLGVGYRATRVFDSDWMEYFGIYWDLFYLGRVNQWFQYNSLKVFLGFCVMWVIILLFILIYYLNSLYLERDTEDVDEVFTPLSVLFIKVFLCPYSENVMFS
jgi:hypothetical protein